MTAATPPVPPGHWLLGQLPGYQADQLGYEKHLAHTYGDVVHVRWVGQHAYLVSHPDDVHRILVDEAEHFNKAPIYRELLAYFLGNGLLTSDGDYWRRQRKLVQPAFHHKRIQAYAQVMADYVRRQMTDWLPGEVHAINQDMMRLTLSIVAKTLFDADIEADAGRIGEALTTALEITQERIKSPIQVIPEWLPTPGNRRRKTAVEALNALVMKIINERRADGTDRGDLLSMLLLMRDEGGAPMSDRQLRDEAVTIVLAGHETTANALTWTWYLLSQHPEVEAQLHAELTRALGDRLPESADLPELGYAEMVIKEAMRLYPPIPSIARQATTAVRLREYTVPAGMIVAISPHILHADPRWYPEPETFRPERFSRANEAALPKGAYVPFSTGPRVCIGNSFALMEATLILATLAQRYHLELEPGQTVRPQTTLTLRPAADLRMRLIPRGLSAAR